MPHEAAKKTKKNERNGTDASRSDLELAVTPRLATTDDSSIAGLAATSRASTLGLRACGVGRLLATLGLTVTTAMRMAMMAHRHTTNPRSSPEPASTARFAKDDVAVIGIAQDTDGRPTIDGDLSDFAGRHHDGCPSTFLIGQPCTDASRATGQRRALPAPRLDDGGGKGQDDGQPCRFRCSQRRCSEAASATSSGTRRLTKGCRRIPDGPRKGERDPTAATWPAAGDRPTAPAGQGRSAPRRRPTCWKTDPAGDESSDHAGHGKAGREK